MTDVTMPVWAGEGLGDYDAVERPRVGGAGRGRLEALLQRARDGWGLVREGNGGAVADAIRTRLASETLAIGLRRDLTLLHPAPPAAMPLVVRPLRPDDDLGFLDAAAGLPVEAARARAAQRRLVAAKLPTCWIALAPDGRPCYMQWLILPRDNARIRARWGDLFPALRADEALLEGAYTAESARGQGIMAHAMARIAAEASCLGARWVVTFVGADNAASLKGCRKAGFTPYLERRESWRLFRRRVRCTPLS